MKRVWVSETLGEHPVRRVTCVQDGATVKVFIELQPDVAIEPGRTSMLDDGRIEVRFALIEVPQ